MLSFEKYTTLFAIFCFHLPFLWIPNSIKEPHRESRITLYSHQCTNMVGLHVSKLLNLKFLQKHIVIHPFHYNFYRIQFKLLKMNMDN